MGPRNSQPTAWPSVKGPKSNYCCVMRVAIVAGIVVARHLKNADDLFDSKSSPRTESLVAAAVQWAEKIMRKIDNVFPK